MAHTTEDILRQVRAQLQEENTKTINDTVILDAVNRGNDYAFDLMIKHYPDPLVFQDPVLRTVDENNEIEILESTFEDRLLKIDAIQSTTYYDMERVSYRDIARIDGTNLTGAPRVYAMIGRKVRILPKPTMGTYKFRMWYVREVENLVKTQGKITAIGTTDISGTTHSYVALDNIGSGLAVGEYINIIDAHTGEIKNSLEILSIDATSGKVVFKETPTRSSVQNKNIDGALADDIELDDLVCLIDGTCIPFFKKPLTNYIIQYAVYEIRRALGYDVSLEERMLKKLEDSVERQWVGRENTKRVNAKNRLWIKRRRSR